jgi:cell division protein ZapA
MSDKRSVKVKIFGSEYTIKGEADAAYMESLAKMVDEKMRELGQPGAVALPKAAILAAFGLADELAKSRSSLQEEREKFNSAGRLAASLDLKLQEALNSPQPQPMLTPMSFEDEPPLPLAVAEAIPPLPEAPVAAKLKTEMPPADLL